MAGNEPLTRTGDAVRSASPRKGAVAVLAQRPGRPAWISHAHQTRDQLAAHLAGARRIPYPARG